MAGSLFFAARIIFTRRSYALPKGGEAVARLRSAAALLFPGSQLVSMLMYVCMPLLAVTLCYQAARVLRRYRPDIWKTLNGGR